MPTGPYLFLYQTLTKYFKLHTQEFGLEIHLGEVTRKTTAEVVSLAYDTPGRYQCLYQTLFKYVQGYQCYGAHKILASGEITT